MVVSLLVSLFALVVAGYLARYVLRQDSGTLEMRVIADAIREGAEAFLRRQYRTIGIMAVRGQEHEDPMTALNRGYYITTVLATIGFFSRRGRCLGTSGSSLLG